MKTGFTNKIKYKKKIKQLNILIPSRVKIYKKLMKSL